MKKKFATMILLFSTITSSSYIYANGIDIKDKSMASTYLQDDYADFAIPTNEIPEDMENVIKEDNKVILTLNESVALVEGKTVQLLTSPKVIDGVTLLPLRFIGDQVVDATITWDQVTKTVTIIKGDTTVIVTMDSKIAIVDGLEIELVVAPKIINNTTLLPLRSYLTSLPL